MKLFICHVRKRCVWELKRVQIEVCHLWCSWEAHNRTTQSEHGVVCAGCLQTHIISVHDVVEAHAMEYIEPERY